MGEAVISLVTAAELLGVHRDALVSARRRGWLPGRGYTPSRAMVADRVLRSFAVNPRAWLLVHPREITDPALRIAAVAAWDAMGRPRWWSAHALAGACCISVDAVRWRRRRGWGDPDRWERWGPHWHYLSSEPPVWETQPASGHQYIERRAALGSWAAVAREAGTTYAAVACAARRVIRNQREATHDPL